MKHSIILLLFIVISLLLSVSQAKSVKLPIWKLRQMKERSVKNSFLVRSPYNLDRTHGLVSFVQEIVRCLSTQITSFSQEIPKEENQLMFWRKNYVQTTSEENSDLMKTAQKMFEREKQLIRKEALLNKRFAAPYIDRLGLTYYGRKGDFGEKKNPASGFFKYPGYSRARSYYPYIRHKERPLSYGVRDATALPWIPRYHRVFKTGLAPRADFPGFHVQLSPNEGKVTGWKLKKLKALRHYFAERGDKTRLFEKN